MPTDHPEVQGYVSRAIYDKLVEFKDMYNLKSMSEAITLALEELFGINTVYSEVSQSELLDRMENVERQVLALSPTKILHVDILATSPSDKREGRLTPRFTCSR